MREKRGEIIVVFYQFLIPISCIKNKKSRDWPIIFLRQCVAWRRSRRRRRRRRRRRKPLVQWRTAAAVTRCHQLRHSVTARLLYMMEKSAS